MAEKEILMVDEFIASLKLGKPQVHKNLTILPLTSDKARDMKLRTLEESLAFDTIEITELDGESVPKLRFVNRGDDPILILQGSILKAGLQDRAVKTTFVVYPHTEVEGDVFCVEEGRWSQSENNKRQSSLTVICQQTYA